MINYIIASKSGLTYLDKDNRLTNDLNKAKRFPRIGEAMQTCVDFNKQLGVVTFKAYSYNTSGDDSPKSR